MSGITAVGAITNDESNNNMLTPPNTTPSTPAQRIKNVSSSSPDIIQGVILRSSPQTMTNTSPTSYGTLESPISNQSVSSGQSPTISDPVTPISSPEFSNYVVDTNSIRNFNNCNMHFNNSASENPLLFYNGPVQPYIEQYNNEISYII
ncbi:19357_t:CDS:1 [Funneliformis geosporum]|uniref:7159_t:CDS:1 n=1 Tax=Funneliformis geosporum TaxID=1117311 RepID=A0A9W4SST1_9GLOM|nr:19357_t:CDS:1 [Funneliformis geosporum]CAI2179555.1 7159_t:CDS:1 [Funneliformis geosporum]